MEEWFFLPDDADDKQGPFTLAQLKAKWKAKAVHAHTYVWNEDLPAWEEICNLPELKAQLDARAAPPVPNRKKPAPAPVRKPRAAASSGESKTAAKKAKPKPAVHRRVASNGRRAPARVKASKTAFAEGWNERRTVDGMPYYYNTVNDNVSWEKPDALKTDEEKAVDSGTWVWVRDTNEAWLPAQRMDGGTGPAKGKVDLKMLDGRRRKMNGKDAGPMWPLKRSALRIQVDDLVMLDDPNEAAIVYNLREHFRQNRIYTWVGASKSVLVSVNPFKMLPLYGPDIIQDYMHPGPTRGQEPHVFAIANSSLRSMQLNETDHAVLISGESGAGKTEATKQVLSFLADAAGSEDNVEQRILMANPVLEAYGNAKTLRNNNSSRFGKWIEVHFDRLGRAITSASIENFLLEKSRVVRQQKDERNYHIFYQLCASDIQSRILGLDDAKSYRYLAGGQCIKVNGMNDEKEFDDVETAMKHLHFESDEKSWMFELTAGILTLGNVEFIKHKGAGNVTESKISNQDVVATAAKLLGVDAGGLTNCLKTRSIEVRGERSVIALAPEAARDGTDALAKVCRGGVYQRRLTIIFRWAFQQHHPSCVLFSPHLSLPPLILSHAATTHASPPRSVLTSLSPFILFGHTHEWFVLAGCLRQTLRLARQTRQPCDRGPKGPLHWRAGYFRV